MREPVDVSAWDAYYAAGRWFRPVMEEERELFRRVVGHGSGRSALDVGCGTGGFAKFLTEVGYRVRGVDCSSEAIERARSNFSDIDGLHFACLNAEGDGWEGLSAYDVISARLTYAFIERKSEFLKDIRDHLNPGGVFHVMTPLSSRLPENRSGIGITAVEVEELCQGWNSVHEYALDAAHVAYTLTV
ncbi:class I SAM-dependent methyltransferase [Streptomyces sp. NPDC007369]|uniref:class I SAM-dependent methyltransferase n=1 Tax=Streptomyces sp. NPDC007369 TaxID=3154589 RepID=UPI0033C77EBE